MTSETKRCTKCGEEKPATAEYFNKRGDGLRSDCKGCSSKYSKAHYQANKGAIAEQRKSYYEANKEAFAERAKIYYQTNKEAFTEKERAHYRTSKGKFTSIKKTSKARGINFSLPFDLYESQLWGKPCHYCGCDIEITGLDRKDNDKGYEVGNVVPSCQSCNAKKYDKPYEEFIAEVKNER